MISPVTYLEQFNRKSLTGTAVKPAIAEKRIISRDNPFNLLAGPILGICDWQIVSSLCPFMTIDRFACSGFQAFWIRLVGFYLKISRIMKRLTDAYLVDTGYRVTDIFTDDII